MKEKLLKLGRCWLLVFPLIYGCAPSLIKMNKEDVVRLKDQSGVQAVHYQPSSFSVQTSGNAMTGGIVGGAVGGLVGLSLFEQAGSKMIKEYSLSDPVLRVQERFFFTLETDISLKNVSFIQEPLGSDSLDELKRTIGKGMVFDFKTTQWTLFHYPTDWSHYRIAYSAQARLIHLEASKILWQGACNFVGQDPNTSPTMDELTANSGALLKVKLNEAADICTEELLAQFFGKEKLKE